MSDLEKARKELAQQRARMIRARRHGDALSAAFHYLRVCALEHAVAELQRSSVEAES